MKKSKLFELKRFRRDKKLTQIEIAEILGCNQNFISRVESGIRQLPQGKVDILEKRYGDISAYFSPLIEPSAPAPRDHSARSVESLEQEIALLKEQLREEKERSERYWLTIQSLIDKK